MVGSSSRFFEKLELLGVGGASFAQAAQLAPDGDGRPAELLELAQADVYKCKTAVL